MVRHQAVCQHPQPILAAFVTPLLSFTLYFCGMHSARHVLRSLRYHDAKKGWPLWTAVGAPMGLVIIGLIAALYWGGDLPLETQLLQLIFVGLAALTVPHMLLVERVRFRGWQT